MKMRPIFSIRVADRCDLFASPNFLFRLRQDRVHVRIIRLHVLALPVFLVSVEHDDDLAPTGARFFREEDLSIRYRVNWIAQVAVFATDAIQVVAQMPILGKRLGVVGQSAVLAADREIETRGGRQGSE
jgi:hypothetical protein